MEPLEHQAEASLEQPIWVQDLLAWLETIQPQNLTGEAWVKRVEEVLAELPGQGLPKEFWPKKAAETEAEVAVPESAASELPRLSDEDRARIQAELDGLQIKNQFDKSKALAAIAAQIPASEPQLLQQVLTAAQTIEDERIQSETLAAIALQIPASEPQLLQQALTTAQNMEDELYRSEALAAVVAQLPVSEPQLLQQAFTTAQNIENASRRSSILTKIAAQLPASERQALIQQALTAAQTIEDEKYRSQALAAVITQLPASEPQLLQQALTAAQNFEYEDYQSQVLAAFAVQILASEPQLLQQALTTAQNIEGKLCRSDILAKIAAQLPASERQALLQQALETAQTIEDENSRFIALASVAVQIPASEPQLLQQALTAAQAIEDEYSRSQVLAAFAVQVLASEPQLLQQALTAAQNIEDERYRSQALAAVAVQIPASEPQLLQSALTTAQNIEDEDCRSQALAAVAVQTPASERQAVLQQALTAAQTIEDEYSRSQALAAVAAHLAASKPQLLQQALTAAQTIEDEQYRLQALAAVAVRLPARNPQLLQQALTAVQAIKDYDCWLYPKAQALAAVAAQLPASERQAVIQQALTAAQNIDEQDRWQAVAAVAAQLPASERQAVLQQALTTVQTMDHYRWQAVVALAAQIPANQPQLLQAALTAAQTIEDHFPYPRSRSLAAVAAQTPTSERQAVLQQALTAAQAIDYEQYQSEALAAIAAQIPGSEPQLLQQALTTTQNIQDEQYRSEALAAVAAQIPASEPQLLEQAFDAAQSIENQSARLNALAAVAAQLPASEPQLLQQFIQIVSAIETPEDRVTALRDPAFRITGALLLHTPQTLLATLLRVVPQGSTTADRARLLSALAPKLSPGLFPRALQLVHTEISHPDYRAEILANLAPYLPTDLLAEALTIVQHHIPGYSYPTTALCALIPHLSLLQIQTALDIASERIPQPPLTSKIFQAVATRLSNASRSRLAPEDLAQKNHLVQDVLSHIQHHSHDEKSIANILSALAPSLDGDSLNAVLANILPKLPSEFYRAQVLAALATAPHFTTEQLDPCREKAMELSQPYPKATALSALMPHFPELRQDVTQLQANAPNAVQKIDLALIVATRPHTDDATYLSLLTTDQTNTLRLIRDQSRDPDKANSLVKLAPHLRQDLLLEAQSVAQDIQDRYHQARSLLALATHFPDGRATALTQIASLQASDPVQHIELLSQYTITVPEQIPPLLKAIEAWADQTPFKDDPKEPDANTFKRRRILIALKPHLPLRLGREIDRETDIGKASQSLWNRALFLLRTGYRQALKSGTLRNDATQDSDLLNLKEEINALTEMLMMRDLEPPVAVGILGGWGGGKSYIMHLMQAHMVKIRSQGIDPIEAWGLQGERKTPDNDRVGRFVGHIYQIKFDAWTYAKADLWASLMQTIFFELDRQITLEQRLAQVLADDPKKPEDLAKVFYDKGDYWSVLYNTNETDRDYFLERILPQDKFEDFQGTQLGSVLWDEFLWEEYGKVKDRDQQQLDHQEQQQATKQKEKEKQQKQLDALNTNIQKNQEQQAQRIQALEQEATEVTQAIESSLRISKIILVQRLGEPVFEAIQKQVEAELHKQNIKTDDIKKLHDSARETVTKILATGKVQEILKNESGEIQLGKIFNLSRQAGKQWVLRNIWLMTGFGVLSLTAVAVPIILANLSIGAQIAGLIVPLVPAIGIAQKLMISSQKWYGQVVTVLSEYGEQVNDFKQNQQAESKKALEQRIEKDKQLVELSSEATDLEKQKQNLDASIAALEQELEELDQALSNTEKLLPKDVYGSLSSFVRSRIEDKSYDQHLGLMHQIKSDLWQLSSSLLPPANASELGVKLDKLKQVFPRGPARVVVYIDDLDRCPPDTVVEVLEAVQLLVKNPLFIAVLAIDERYINRALAKHYQGVLSLQGRPSSADYLEKIIQIPYRIRPIDEIALRNYLRAQVVIQDSETSGTKFNEFSPKEFNLLVQCCQESELSPRSLKRLTNVYKLYKVLSRTRGHRPTRREQKAILALLAFSSRYPDLMRDIIEEIGSHYEEGRHLLGENGKTETLTKVINTYLDKYERLNPTSVLIQDTKKLRHDVKKLVDDDLELKEIRQIFDFVRSFSFVGDIGTDYTVSH